MAKLTGERPLEGATPDSLLALHGAGYREVRTRLGPGRVLDAGCGEGFASATLRAGERSIFGVDYDAAAARQATRRHGVPAACSDAASLALRRGSFDWVVSSHVIEHFVAPARHVAELARVLAPDGTALVLTPNAPWDFENPFHLALFRRDDLYSLLSQHFSEVWVGGLAASERAEADFAVRRAKAVRLLRIADPLDLRHHVPRSWWIAAYSRGLPLAYRLFAREDLAGASGIGEDDFTLTEEIEDSTPVLFAVASRPRR